MVIRVFTLIRDIFFGTILCLNPVTSLAFLGWLSRRMRYRSQVRLGQHDDPPRWLYGTKKQNALMRLVGGLVSNITAGLKTLVGLAIWTLPFGLTWLGAWWAGWDNSFNKGYEQAFVGPTIWLAGSLIAVLSLSHFPFALAHGACEQRVGAFLEFRKIRSLRAAAGWRCVWIAFTSVFLALPFLGSRALPVFIEGIIPGFSEMTASQHTNVGYVIAVLTAGYATISLMTLRDQAAKTYAIAAPIAAGGRDAKFWDGHNLSVNANPRKLFKGSRSVFWLVASCIIWTGLVAQILVGQFMNYGPHLWLTHPFFMLPWYG